MLFKPTATLDANQPANQSISVTLHNRNQNEISRKDAKTQRKDETEKSSEK
jgi:hypothetical protein